MYNVNDHCLDNHHHQPLPPRCVCRNQGCLVVIFACAVHPVDFKVSWWSILWGGENKVSCFLSGCVVRWAHWEVDDDDGDDADEVENDDDNDENDENDDGDEEEKSGDNDENGDYLDQPSAIHLPLLQNRAPEKYFFRLSSKRTKRSHLVVFTCPPGWFQEEKDKDKDKDNDKLVPVLRDGSEKFSFELAGNWRSAFWCCQGSGHLPIGLCSVQNGWIWKLQASEQTQTLKSLK